MNNKQVPPSVAQFIVSERAELLARIAEQAREIEPSSRAICFHGIRYSWRSS